MLSLRNSLLIDAWGTFALIVVLGVALRRRPAFPQESQRPNTIMQIESATQEPQARSKRCERR